MAGGIQTAYLLDRFPSLSETFILHEILELERQGLDLRLFALAESRDAIAHAAAAEVRSPVTYLGNQRRGALIAATLRRLRKSPWRFVRTSALLAWRFRRRATVRWMLYGAFLAEQCERAGIGHLHAHYAHDPTSVALTVNLLTDIPYSFTAHAFDIYLTPAPELASKIRGASFVITCTAANQQLLLGVAGEGAAGKIHCIYHGVNVRRFPSGRSEPRAPLLILAVGRIVEKKGLTYLVRACRSLADRGYDFACRVVGDGPLRPALAREIADLELEDRITLWGPETQERVLEMYREAAVAVLPCVVAESGDRDGIPNVLVEAMAMGVPVVSTPVSSIPELIAPEVNGLLVPPQDAGALAGALERLFEDEDLRRRLACAGQSTIAERFDLTVNAARLRELLCSVSHG
jgi:glycosyltransferase involved in cell wall biosynthesis